ncbi:TRAP-type C4-dicarboxylate transport system substrate-binding protein [Sinobacterium caligoides]|uniref:TRAP-type C4-dicarboxylate transport system substrate-binding protein n=1 Tax=Sinobacterium caligoides TaxID=933926 RepID=A0A3N2DP64_9GAMM|nr:TRAP transporter substrate-binding protein DctP [Sinobacterium caligoides]ROS01492.1 TRAP-type C4-dicarboxylate transport system substrate-binding protein [Sinobacterium caligoides]
MFNWIKKSLFVGAMAVTSATLWVGAAGATTLKIATLSPDGSAWMREMRQAGKDIKQQTDGRVVFKFYPGGVMGSDDAVLRKIRIGQLNGGAMTGGSLSRFAPDSQAYNLPLKFRSFDEVDYVRKRLDPVIEQKIHEGGFVTFGLAEGGLAYTMSKHPIDSVESLRGSKVWIPNDDKGAQQATDAFGVAPIPLQVADVLAGLQTGLVDTVATSPIGAIALQWHTQISTMTDVPMLYFYAVLAIDKKAYKRVSAADQKIVDSVMTAAFKRIDSANRKDNLAAFDALQGQGVKIIELSAEERQRWYKLAADAEQTIIKKGVVSQEMADKVDSLLTEYRGTVASH